MSSGLQQAITHVLQQDNAVLGRLLTKIELLNHLNKIFTEQLDPQLARHCQLVNYEDKHLIVMTNNAIWATQFRFQIPQLISKLRLQPAFSDLLTVQCKIIPLRFDKRIPEAQQKPKMALSLKTAEIVLATAKTIKDPRLQAIMEKIAKHNKGDKQKPSSD
jgi:hypothetical protein